MGNRKLDLSEHIFFSFHSPHLSSLSRLGISTNKCFHSLPFSPLVAIFSGQGRTYRSEIDPGYTEPGALSVLCLRTFAHAVPYDLETTLTLHSSGQILPHLSALVLNVTSPDRLYLARGDHAISPVIGFLSILDFSFITYHKK